MLKPKKVRIELSKYFENCAPSQRKFIYRKLVSTKNKLFRDFNSADFYSDDRYTRVKAIKALLKENWGKYEHQASQIPSQNW